MLNRQNAQLLEKFDKEYLENEKTSFRQKLKIFNIMLREYISLKIYKKNSSLEDIETDIKIAKILNNLK